MATAEASLLTDRSDWRTVRFGDVVENVNIHESDPLANGLSRYVGLEHLSSDSLKIEGWGDIAEGTSFTKRFGEGQVLFPKRRVYQRKFAYTDFEGLCSGDILVFQPKNDELLPELLPFIVQTESFVSHAIDTSAGSLSPRTRWRDLVTYEFALPPKRDQERIAQVLWSAVGASGTYVAAGERIQAARRSSVAAVFKRLREGSPQVAIRELGDVQLGRQRAPKYMTGNHPQPYLRVLNVGDGYLDLADIAEMDFDPRDLERYSLRPGDILITEGDITSPLNVGRSAVYQGEIGGCCYQNTLIRFRPGEKLDSHYVNAAFQDLRYRGRFAAIASTTTVTHLGGNRFSLVKIPLPHLEEQKRIARQLQSIDSAMGRIRDAASEARKLEVAVRQGFLGRER